MNVSSHNQFFKNKYIQSNLSQHWTLRKLPIGLASVLLGLTFSVTISHADTINPNTKSKTTQSTPMQSALTTTPTNQINTSAMSIQPTPTTVQTNQSKPVTQTSATSSSTPSPSAQSAVQTNLSLIDPNTNQAYDSNIQGETTTEFHTTVQGTIDVPLKNLLNRQDITLANVTTTSSTGKYMNFVGRNFNVTYQNTAIGKINWNYDETTGNGSLILHSTLNQSPFKDMADDAILSLNLVKVPELASFNWQTDPHKLVPLDPDGTFHETVTLNFVNGQDKSYIFKLKPHLFDVETSPMWTNISAGSSAEAATFNDYVTPLFDQNTASTINQLNQGQFKLDSKTDSYDLYYVVKPVGNSQLNLNDFSIYVNMIPNIVNSNGQITKETFWINGPDLKQAKVKDVTFNAADDNLSFGALSLINFNGAVYSKQADGSAKIAVKIPKSWITMTDADFHQLVDKTTTGVFDKKGEVAAEAATKKYYAQLNNLPTRFAVGFWLPFSSDSLHHDNKFALSRVAVDGSIIHQGQAQQPDSQVDLHGQTQVNVHFVSTFDGSDVTIPLSSVGWPSQDHFAPNWTASLPIGYQYTASFNNHLINDQTYILPAGYQVLTTSTTNIDYPVNGATNYIIFVTPKQETAKINIVDEDYNQQTLTTANLTGYYGQKIIFTPDDSAYLHPNNGYKLVSSDFVNNAETFQDRILNFTMHLAHIKTPILHTAPLAKDAKTVSGQKINGGHNADLNRTVTRQINIHKPDGSILTTTQTAQIFRDAVYDEVNGNITYQDWSTGTWQAFMPETIPGYTIATAPAQAINVNTQDQTLNLTYQALTHQFTINFYNLAGNLITTSHLSGKTGQTVALTSVIPDGYQLASGQIIPSTVQFGTNDLDYDFLINHRLVFISSTSPVHTGDLIPNTTARTYPAGLTDIDLNRIITRTLIIHLPTGKTTTKTQTVHFVRNAVIDAVTGEVHYLNWSENGIHRFAGYVPAAIDNYQVDFIEALTVTPDNQNTTFDVTYQPIQTTVTVNYITANGNVVQAISTTPSTDGTITLTAPAGYHLMTPTHQINLTSRSRHYNVVIVPNMQTYTNHDANIPTAIKNQLIKIITRTINITLPNGHFHTIKQTVKFTRTAMVDSTGQVIYSAWQPTSRTQFNNVFIPKRVGYHVLIKDNAGNTLTKLNKLTVTPELTDTIINISYVK